jgi:hypothetical protein
MPKATDALHHSAPATRRADPRLQADTRIQFKADRSEIQGPVHPEIAPTLARILDERINRGITIVARELVSDGTERITLRNVLP